MSAPAHDIIRRSARRTDRATLIATSDPEEAYEVADRILIIDRHTLRPVVMQMPPLLQPYREFPHDDHRRRSASTGCSSGRRRRNPASRLLALGSVLRAGAVFILLALMVSASPTPSPPSSISAI